MTEKIRGVNVLDPSCAINANCICSNRKNNSQKDDMGSVKIEVFPDLSPKMCWHWLYSTTTTKGSALEYDADWSEKEKKEGA
jgi:hypothetical protein